MLAVTLALIASCSWGLADFTGGLKSRTLPVALVLLVVEGTGLVLVLAAIVLRAEPPPSARAIVLGLVAGAVGVGALGCFYRALAVGTMGVVAPVSATGVALPVVVGIVTGDTLSVVVSAGLALTVCGVVLASREESDPPAERPPAQRGGAGILLALVAAAGFGTYFVMADAAADESVLWLLALSRIVALPVLVPLAAGRARPRRADVPPLLLAGVLDVSATGLYGLANRHGALSIVAVVGGLYPVVTVLLARFVLQERLRRIQAAGVLAALLGVVLVVTG